MYIVSYTPGMENHSEIQVEIPGERYCYILNNKAVAILFPSDLPDTWILEPVREEEWWPVLYRIQCTEVADDYVSKAVWETLKQEYQNAVAI